MKCPAHSGRWLLALILIVLVTSAILAYQPLLIHYHRQELNRAWSSLERGQTVHIQFEWLARFGLARLVKHHEIYEEHRDKLVDLGYLEYEEFVCRHILEQTDEYRGMWSEMNRHASRRAENYFESDASSASRAAGPMHIRVWDTPERMVGWRQFMEEHDVPNFFQHFPDARVPAPEAADENRVIPSGESS